MRAVTVADGWKPRASVATAIVLLSTVFSGDVLISASLTNEGLEDVFSPGTRLVPEPVSISDEILRSESVPPGATSPPIARVASRTLADVRGLVTIPAARQGESSPRPEEAGGRGEPLARVDGRASPPGSLGHLDGKIDAGGPYGGPGTFEGDTLTFNVTTTDPSVLFFRWDFNNDSVFDHPDQTGGGDIGRWTSVKTQTRKVLDDHHGDLVVEGWDGTSQRLEERTGTNLGENRNFQQFLGAYGATLAWEFEVKRDMQVTRLGHYHYLYPLFDMRLWDGAGNLLASCSPPHVQYRWNWCTLPRPVFLEEGNEYLVAIRIESYMVAIDTPPDSERLDFHGTYYCLGPNPNCFPSQFWLSRYIPLIDFAWREIHIFPDAARDTSPLEVNNVAPTVSGISADPSPAPEGSGVNLTASFDDPGLLDEWQVRWTSGSLDSGWLPVPRILGGAKVLILHSWTGDIDTIRTNIVDACDNFCVKVDELDFGPLGQNRIPTLDELTQYDVLLVGTNWGPIPNSNAMGDRLAEFMDAAGETGGGIIPMAFALYNNDIWGIGGRWASEKSPFPRAGGAFGTSNLGTIYVPDHPLLEGVSDVSAFYRLNIMEPTAGSTRIADYEDGRVFAAEKVDSGGRIACGLNYFPALNVGGDYLRVVRNAIRYCSRQEDPIAQTMPFALQMPGWIFPDDDPATATQLDALPVRVEVRDDDGGYGTSENAINVSNVDAQAVGGFDTAERDPNGNVTFKGFRIEDPALWELTEWFAYAWDFGDGTPVQWEYKGNMTPPTFDVLLLHTLCQSGNACADFTGLQDTLLRLDDVRSVDGFNFINYPGSPQVPSLALLLSYDVVVVAMNWGYASYPIWDFARRQVGNRLAQYIDADGGGVMTLMTALDPSPGYGDGSTLSGRYVEEDYGPFEKASLASGGSSLGAVVDPDHDTFVRVRSSKVQSGVMHSGNYSLTVGGGGQASGRNGTLLARWSDGNSAIGVKELNNGRRTVHLGLHWKVLGEDTPQLLRNAIGWVAGGIPSPILPPITHQFGNSPPYTVDLMVIDDDMGWAWDDVLGVPVEVNPPAVISHRYITIT